LSGEHLGQSCIVFAEVSAEVAIIVGFVEGEIEIERLCNGRRGEEL
jgi:hypothetical protein